MLFKESANSNFTEIKKYLPVSVSSDWAVVKPFIESCEDEYIKPVLGEALYDHLIAYYNDPDVEGEWIDDLQVYFDDLLKLVQRALINLAYWQGYDIMSITMDAAGFHREETDTRKGLYKYQEESLKNGFKSAGFNGIDKLLTYLDTHGDIFTDFAESEYYTQLKSSIVPDTKTFNDIYFIDNSRLVFLKFRRFINQVEDFTIQSVLGSTLYSLVKTEIVKETPDAAIVALVPYLQKPIVHLSVAKGLAEVGINITDRMIFLESQETATINTTTQTPADLSRLDVMIRNARITGDQYLSLLKSFLSANSDDYPDYEVQTGSVYTRDNTDKKTFWA